jgi:NADPH2:quinone reductase
MWTGSIMKAVLISHSSVDRLEIGDAALPRQQASETLVAVKAFSLNRGDIRRAEVEPHGTQAGWDFSGIVYKSAPDGSGPPRGTRVVGLSRRREGFAEFVSVPSTDVAEIPDGVSFVDAAALPVAGLTALYCLERCERLLGSNILITGASGGVGVFACQLAVAMGANVFGQIRRTEHESLVASTGAIPILTPDGSAVFEQGPFQNIIDGVGGAVLANVLPSLSKDGRAVLYGFTHGSDVNISVPELIMGAGRIEGFYLFREPQFAYCGSGLVRLARLVDAGRIECHVNVTADWSEIGSVLNDLANRRFTGKAVLTL